ncbi:hypothetical protein LR48_Vigan02g109300 [Vigna angularis]|uniref:Uncharacterized protein n=1 Tax=Phaseolus angularis TaxID=3914 RepID=A0A0L9TWK9_PHAAN|nr:hypothetical protein LR48_Vigan02g109300 [Vigna angularis]
MCVYVDVEGPEVGGYLDTLNNHPEWMNYVEVLVYVPVLDIVLRTKKASQVRNLPLTAHQHIIGMSVYWALWNECLLSTVGRVSIEYCGTNVY